MLTQQGTSQTKINLSNNSGRTQKLLLVTQDASQGLALLKNDFYLGEKVGYKKHWLLLVRSNIWSI